MLAAIPKIELPKPPVIKEQIQIKESKTDISFKDQAEKMLAAIPKIELPKPPVAAIPKIELPKSPVINDPSQIKESKIDTSFRNQAEKMLENQTQGVFSNLRTAFSKQQQQRQMAPNITDEFKNYQPKTATVTPVAQTAEPIVRPALESKETVTIKDLNDQLMMLNNSIAQLVQSSTTNGSFAEQQIRVTKKLSGNRFG